MLRLTARRLGILGSAAVIAVPALLFGTVPAAAAACVVNSTADAHAANAATGCASTLGSGVVTLRSAIEHFNSTGGTNTITFGLPSPSVITETNGELAITNGTLSITGPGARSLAIDGNAANRVFHLGNHSSTPAVTVNLSGVTVRNGKTPTVSYPTYSGGGIFVDGTGTTGVTLNLDSSTITGNAASWGAAIDQEGVARVTNSTLSNGTISGSHCGGAAIETESETGGTTLTNVTIAGNHAGTCDVGGTLAFFSGTNALTNVTLNGNSGTGSALFRSDETVTNSIIANQTGSPACGAHPTDGGSNLDNDGTCGFTAGTPKFDLPSTSPLLGPLANNGGPTDTMALKAGSPAIDAVKNACPPPATDQRGVSRPQGAACDMGAFEFSQPRVTSVTASCGAAAGGGAVTINGSGFLGATAVSFGGKPAQTFTVVSDTQINATAPAGTAGQAVDITVTTTTGTSSTGTQDRCTYVAAAATAAPALPKAGSGVPPAQPGGWVAAVIVVVIGLLGGAPLLRATRR